MTRESSLPVDHLVTRSLRRLKIRLVGAVITTLICPDNSMDSTSRESRLSSQLPQRHLRISTEAIYDQRCCIVGLPRTTRSWLVGDGSRLLQLREQSADAAASDRTPIRMLFVERVSNISVIVGACQQHDLDPLIHSQWNRRSELTLLTDRSSFGTNNYLQMQWCTTSLGGEPVTIEIEIVSLSDAPPPLLWTSPESSEHDAVLLGAWANSGRSSDV